MNWAYVLMIGLIVGGYFLMHFLRVKHTRKMEELIKSADDRPGGEPDAPVPPDVTRDMVQSPDKYPVEDKNGGA